MPLHVLELRKKKITCKRATFEDLKEVIYTLVQLVPIGFVITYSDIAKILRINPRIVGKILSENRQPIVIPCHRVVSSKGLGGYTLLNKKAVDFKKKLLKLEAHGEIRKFNLYELLGLK
jgi:methylated-DNA-[protein]-cysteine S-methyltransferase